VFYTLKGPKVLSLKRPQNRLFLLKNDENRLKSQEFLLKRGLKKELIPIGI